MRHLKYVVLAGILLVLAACGQVTVPEAEIAPLDDLTGDYATGVRSINLGEVSLGGKKRQLSG